MLNHLLDVPKRGLDAKCFGVFDHQVTENMSRLMTGFTYSFPMAVSRYSYTSRDDILAEDGLELLAASQIAVAGMCRDQGTRDIFILNHLEYDAETLAAEYHRDASEGLETALPYNYFPNDDPSQTPINFWRPFAYLFMANWLHDLYQATPFDLSNLAKD